LAALNTKRVVCNDENDYLLTAVANAIDHHTLIYLGWARTERCQRTARTARVTCKSLFSL